ncbi:NADH-quinone oxidoreductase subunit K [uncultured Prevotella sp.]|uniref:NADH-quinone oxidoreductase subunit NuoK n=1 Tax=uncultured Prevotella sp. TaxID=159272 RepID=UPI00258DF960|nr:NADH-quinone oxidoreductase subunit K [uncultured Prevotella sp.]
MVPVECYFVLSALLFFIGVYGFVTRRNLIAFMTLFSIGVSAAESAVAIAIIINVFRNFKSDSVDAISNMKG